jgi:glycosyltransferase involved in cell wall biosynthesis
LRVAILGTRGIPAQYGGFETFAEQLSVRLAARGHHVTVYAESPDEDVAEAIYQGVYVRYMPVPRWGSASVIGFDIRCLWDARQRFDVVYMLGYGAAFACWLPRWYGTPVWINIDGLEWARSKWSGPARAFLRVMEWMSSKTASVVIADALAIRQRYLDIYPHGAPCKYIAYGAELVAVETVDPAPLSTWELQPSAYALVVARPEPENHVLEIVQGHLKHRGEWPLVVVGDVTGVNAYQRQLLSLASTNVRFIGGVYDPVLLTCLRTHAGLYIHGHSVGGTNPSLLEALACGNVIAAHDNPFNREVARNASDYFETPEQLADLMEKLYTLSAEDRQLRGLHARQIVTDHYTWTRIADAYEALLETSCQTQQMPEAPIR